MDQHTPQKLDPLAGVTGQMFVWGISVTSIVIAASLTSIHFAEYNDHRMLVLALVAVAGACVVTVLASAPHRAPFTRADTVLVHMLCLIAVVCEAAAQWGTDATVRSDWGPIAYALLVAVTGCYRPARWVLISSTAGAAVVAAVTIAGQLAYGSGLPPVVYAVLTAGPVLAAGVGAAAFSHVIVDRLLSWRAATQEQRAELAEALREEVRAEVRAERLALVELEVAPYLRGLLAADQTDAASAARAAELGEALRRALVEEVDGVWLSDLVDVLEDPDGFAARMDGTQRAVIEAACASLPNRRVAARLARSGDGIRLVLEWERGEGSRLRPELQALIRLTFPGARLRPSSRRIELEFTPARRGEPALPDQPARVS